MSSRNGNVSINSERLKAIAEFMQALDELSSGGVEIVGTVTVLSDGQEIGTLDCLAGSETVWST